MGETIGIVGLKGGVGKTTTVMALGGALSKFGKKVLLVDANFSAPNLGVHNNILDPQTTLHSVLGRKANIADALYKTNYFDVLPSSLFARIKINPLKLRDKLKFIKKKYDITLIDSSPALNDETLAATLASDRLLVVTTPDYPTMGTTLKAIKIAKTRGANIAGLVLNKVHNKNFELSLEDIQKTSETPVLAVVPHEINVLRAHSKFLPLTIHKPRSEASQEYRKLAAALIGEPYHSLKFKDLFRISPKKQEVNRELLYDRVFE